VQKWGLQIAGRAKKQRGCFPGCFLITSFLASSSAFMSRNIRRATLSDSIESVAGNANGSSADARAVAYLESSNLVSGSLEREDDVFSPESDRSRALTRLIHVAARKPPGLSAQRSCDCLIQPWRSTAAHRQT
jgi:hypothetical protein